MNLAESQNATRLTRCNIASSSCINIAINFIKTSITCLTYKRKKRKKNKQCGQHKPPVPCQSVLADAGPGPEHEAGSWPQGPIADLSGPPERIRTRDPDFVQGLMSFEHSSTQGIKRALPEWVQGLQTKPCFWI